MIDKMNPVKEGYYNKLKNKLFGLLCEFEKDREWESFLNSILIELMGLKKNKKLLIIIFYFTKFLL